MREELENACGFILDCDGTLLDSIPAWDKLEDELRRRAVVPITDEEWTVLQGAPISEAARLLYEEHGICSSAQEVEDLADAFLMNVYQNEVEPLPGAVAFVEQIYAAGKPFVVVSSSPQRYLIAGLERCHMLSYATAVMSTDDEGLAKSEPTIYQLAMEKMNVSAEETWCLDDSPYALETMKSVGLHTVGVCRVDTAEYRAELALCSEIVVANPGELL